MNEPSMPQEVLERIWEDHIRPFKDSQGWLIIPPHIAKEIGAIEMRTDCEHEDYDMERQQLIDERRDQELAEEEPIESCTSEQLVAILKETGYFDTKTIVTE